jgi:hypothetical protein
MLLHHAPPNTNLRHARKSGMGRPALIKGMMMELWGCLPRFARRDSKHRALKFDQ